MDSVERNMRQRKKAIPAREPKMVAQRKWKQTPSGLWAPQRPLPVYPIHISTGVQGQRIRGTKAFAPRGEEETLVPLRAVLREAKRLRNATGVTESFLAGQVGMTSKQLKDARGEIARRSSHFLKTVTPKQRAIREILIKAGVPIEQPLKNFETTMQSQKGKKTLLELFERGQTVGFRKRRLPADFPVKNCAPLINQMIQIVSKMHQLGITHNHPHLGNFVVSPNGHVTILDVRLAKQFSRQPKTKEEFVKRYKRDIEMLTTELTLLECTMPGTKWFGFDDNLAVPMREVAREILGTHQRMRVNTFGVTAWEILGMT